MKILSLTEQLVLNAGCDDFENLEQVYRSIALEFSAENFDPSDVKSFYWRQRIGAPSLAEIADTIKKLITEGLLEARTESGTPPNTEGDSAFVWRTWFRTTERGMEVLRRSDAGD